MGEGSEVMAGKKLLIFVGAEYLSRWTLSVWFRW